VPTASYILFGLATVWCIAWVARASRGWIMPLLLMASGAVHWLLADQGYYRNVVSFPPPQMALLVPLIIGMVLLFALPGGRRWLLKADIKALTALHILRIPVEIVLHEAYLKGHVPKAMTYSGHNFDILTGLSAVFSSSMTTSATPAGLLIACGVSITSTPSTFGPSSTARSAFW